MIDLKTTSKMQKKLIVEINHNSEFNETYIGGNGSRAYKSAVTLVKKYPDIFEIEMTERTKAKLSTGQQCVIAYNLQLK